MAPSPASGYRFEDHVADITAAAAELGSEKFAMMGYSIGAAYALGFAAGQPGRIAGLIVGDYPARYCASPPNARASSRQHAGSR